MERLFRSFNTEWLPSIGYMTAQEAQRDISHYLMHRLTGYGHISLITDWHRPSPKKNLT